MFEIKKLVPYQLRNRILLCIILIIITQSVFYAVSLKISGVYDTMREEPYKMLDVQIQEKMDIATTDINNDVLALGNLENNLIENRSKKAVEKGLLETLNFTKSASDIFYLDIDNRKVLAFKDFEPDVQFINYGDIICTYGDVDKSHGVAISRAWKKDISIKDWVKVTDDIKKGRFKSGFRLVDDGFYYMHVFFKDGYHILGFKVSENTINSYLQFKKSVYEDTQLIVFSEDKVVFSNTEELKGEKVIFDKEERIHLDHGEGDTFIGLAKPLVLYGNKDNEEYYVGIISEKKNVDKVNSATNNYIMSSYISAIAIAGVGSLIMINVVLSPIGKFKEAITLRRENKKIKEVGCMEMDELGDIVNGILEQLNKAEKRYSFIMQVGKDLIASYAYISEGKLVEVSDNFSAILDVDPDLYISRNVIKTADFDKLLSKLEPAKDMPEILVFDDENGKKRAVKMSSILEDEGAFGIVVDVSDNYKEITRLQYLSYRDQLTGIYNASYFQLDGQKRINQNINKIGAVAFFDLDNLKMFNDNYGHEMGDIYIQTMANALKDMASNRSIMVARMSGDEFAALFYNFEDKETIMGILQEFFDNRPYIDIPDGSSIRLNASCGVAFSPVHSVAIKELIKYADFAMYKVKHGTKGDISIFEG